MARNRYRGGPCGGARTGAVWRRHVLDRHRDSDSRQQGAGCPGGSRLGSVDCPGSREWNDANVLAMSLKRLSADAAVEVLDVFLSSTSPTRASARTSPPWIHPLPPLSAGARIRLPSFSAFWMQTAVIRPLFTAVCIQNAGGLGPVGQHRRPAAARDGVCCTDVRLAGVMAIGRSPMPTWRSSPAPGRVGWRRSTRVLPTCTPT